jgi:cytochrome c5
MGTGQAAAAGALTLVRLLIFAGALGGAFGMDVTSRVARAQEAARTVADGVYTDSQASRGAEAYDRECSGCHRADLSGTTGPSLKAQRFARVFAGKDLKTLFTKIATTMPRNNPASLADDIYLDIVAHVLKENGFRSGTEELSADALETIRVVSGQPKPPPPVGDFSYVEVVGCLVPGPEHTWLLARATEPASVAPTAPAAPPTSTGPLGTNTFRLLDAMAYAPEAHSGHKMYVRGLLVRLAGEPRLTISVFEAVSPTCSD